MLAGFGVTNSYWSYWLSDVRSSYGPQAVKRAKSANSPLRNSKVNGFDGKKTREIKGKTSN